jgi:chitinase
MRIKFASLFFLLTVPLPLAHAQGAVPTFQYTVGQNSYTLLGRDPALGGVTTIPTVLVPIKLSFEAKKAAGKPFVTDASPYVNSVLNSPIFSKFDFPSGGKTQYADALLRTTFPSATGWHTLLGKPKVKPVKITVPVGYGYILTSKKGGAAAWGAFVSAGTGPPPGLIPLPKNFPAAFAVVDIEFLEKELFKQLPKQDGKLVIAVTHNTTFYADADATVCCTWGTHGIDSATGDSFVLSSYLSSPLSVIEDRDVQPLTQQLGEFINDPRFDSLLGLHNRKGPGNSFPRWMRPASMRPGDEGPCGGSGVASAYFLLAPTDTNPKNNFPTSMAFVAQKKRFAYHLENIALLPWYTAPAEGLGSVYSFPDAQVLSEPAKPCPARGRRPGAEGGARGVPEPTVAPAPLSGPPNGHELIGYAAGYGPGSLPLRDIAPQWDVIIVAFATPLKNAPEGTFEFRTPLGLDTEQFKRDIASKRSQGKKVLISLGGGGVYVPLDGPDSVSNFVSSVSGIVADYGFDGVDIDLESPSLDLAPGDRDFKHPTTPSVVNLISGLRQLREHFGSSFMITLVPEGTQIPAGYVSYGGQFGSYLPLTYALRDILSFVDVQDYNTPPLEGLDGEIYQAGSVDYHAAMTELLLQGFNVGGDPKQFFPPLPANKVAVGFLIGDATPTEVSHAMDFLITGKPPAGTINELRQSILRRAAEKPSRPYTTTYELRRPGGYPGLIGAMFWTIDADRRGNYNFSNVVGPQLHSYPATKP